MLPNYSDNPLKYYEVLNTLTPDQLKQEWKQTSEEEFHRMLNILPPIRFVTGAFMVGEQMTHNENGRIYQAFIKVGDQYWQRPAYLHTFNPIEYRKEIREL